MKILKPIRDSRLDYENLENKILRVLRQEIYIPLLKHLDSKIFNSKKDLIDAIEAGHIKYQDNGFVGIFSAEISKELKKLGAVWSKRSPKWLIRTELLSREIQTAISKSSVNEELLRFRVLKELGKISVKTESFDATKLFEIVCKNTEIKFQKTIEGITIAPKLSEAAKQKMAEEYSQNLKKYIQGFTEEEILRLRKDVEEHVFKGNRYKELIEKIKTSYGVSQRKAKFLASQETKLLTSKLKEVRYKDVGIDEYIWQTVKGTSEHPVRPMHKKLNGTKQRFSSPPITNEKGQRNNPGEDYRCRCVARPIVKF